MAKHKLQRFRDMATYPHVVEPPFDQVFNQDFPLKSHWSQEFFLNSNPITLELGCGKGEYTVALAQRNPNVNHIGVDIKGARMWVGATQALNNQIPNVAFLRTRIEFLRSCFAQDEVSEIWLTFPDPQPQYSRRNRRLTSAKFLNGYKLFLKPNAIIRLKTDSDFLYNYTCKLLQYNNITPIISTNDLYAAPLPDDILGLETHYEKLFKAKGFSIKYLVFTLPTDRPLEELPYDLVKDLFPPQAQ